MTYPATNLNEAVGLIVPDSNALHDIVNGDADSTVITPEGCEVPTVLKAMADSLLFKDPTPWEEGSLEQEPLQLRTFTDGLIYWAPTAQLTNPIAMGASPIGDNNWKISPVIKTHNSLPNRSEAGAHPASAIDMGNGNSLADLASPDSSVIIGGIDASEVAARTDDFLGVGRNFIQALKLNRRDVNLYILGDSTSGPSYPWVLQLAGKLAELFTTHTVTYRLFSDSLNDYGALSTVSLGSGPNKINIINASVPGATATYFCSHRREKLWVDAPDLVVFNYGHNLGSIATTNQIFSFMYSSLLDIMGDFPLAEYALTIQNIDVSLLEYSERQAAVVQNIASICNIGTIDFRTVFAEKYYKGEIAEWMADSVHPNEAGWTVMSNIVLRSLLTRKKVNCTPTNPLRAQKANLLYNEHFFEWPAGEEMPMGFFKNSTVTVARDLEDHETMGYSVKIANNGSAGLGLFRTDQSEVLEQIDKSNGLTFAARVKAPVGVGANAGRVELSLGAATVSSFGQTQGRGGWMWVAAYATPEQLKSATQLVLSIYAGNNADSVNIDRLTIAEGRAYCDGQFKLIRPTQFYRQENVIPKTANDNLNINADGSFTVSNSISLYPGVGVNIKYLQIGKLYRATWVTTVAGNSSGAYVRDFGLVGGLRESVTPLGVVNNGLLRGSLDFLAIKSTACIQMEIINTIGTTFTITEMSIVEIEILPPPPPELVQH